MIPVQPSLTPAFAAAAASCDDTCTYTRYPCLRAVATKEEGGPPFHENTTSLMPSELAGGNAGLLHCTNTPLQAGEEIMRKRLKATVLEKSIRFFRES